MLVAASRLLDDPPAAGRLSLLFTADEENGAAFGARHVAATVPLDADGVVIGEPGGIDEDYDRLHWLAVASRACVWSPAAEQGHSSLADELGSRNAGRRRRAARRRARRAGCGHAPNRARSRAAGRRPSTPGWLTGGGVGYGVLPGVMAVDTEVRLLPGMGARL